MRKGRGVDIRPLCACQSEDRRMESPSLVNRPQSGSPNGIHFPCRSRSKTLICRQSLFQRSAHRLKTDFPLHEAPISFVGPLTDGYNRYPNYLGLCVGENPASCTQSAHFYNLLAERSIENDVLVVEGVVPHAVQPNDVVGGAIHSVDDVDDFKTHGLSTERIRLQD